MATSTTSSTGGSSTSAGTGPGPGSGTGSGSSGSTGTAETSSSSGDSGASTGVADGAICPSVYKPVCGKDGETYDNACTVPDGVEIRREGPCFGDCEGSCTVVGSPGLSMVLSIAALLWLRRAPKRPRSGR